MRHAQNIIFVVVSLIAGCATKALPPVTFSVPTLPADYLTEVKPIEEPVQGGLFDLNRYYYKAQ
jgi:hypothetical protein